MKENEQNMQFNILPVREKKKRMGEEKRHIWRMAKHLLNLVKDINLQVPEALTNPKKDKYKENQLKCIIVKLLK